jgi:hypothetical protein
MSIGEETSKLLLTALCACPDAAPSYWYDSAAVTNWTWFLDYSGVVNYTPPVAFDKPSWLCRNRTLALAIEGLFNNITVSMLATNIS